MASIPIHYEPPINKDSILLVDMDGTLIETNHANYLSYQKAIKDILSIDINCNFRERFTRKILRKIFPLIDDKIFNYIIKLKEKYYLEFIDKTHPNTPLINLLKQYNTNKKFLVTKCSKERGIQTLTYHNLLCFFYDVIYATTNNKYREGIEIYSLNPTDIIIFEDDNLEIENALKTGILNQNIMKINILNSITNGKIYN